MRKSVPKFRALFVFLLLIALCRPAQAITDTTEPGVKAYTGLLHHAARSEDQLIRVYLISRSRFFGTVSEPPHPKYSAIVTLHWGEFDPIEYVSFFYDQVHYKSETQEYFLEGGARETRGLPQIRLKLSSDDGLLVGFYSSSARSFTGEMRLVPGLKPPPLRNSLIQPYGGVYVGTCSSADSTGKPLQAIEIIPSRIPFSQMTPNERPLAFSNYIGTAICYSGGFISCGSFQSGINDFYNDKLILFQGGWTWVCERSQKGAIGEIVCESPRYPGCHLKKKESLQVPQGFGTEVPYGVTSQVRGATEWSGDFEGLLTHEHTGKQQYFELHLSTTLVSDPPSSVKTTLSGNGKLYFGPELGGPQSNSYVFPRIEIDPAHAVQVLLPHYDEDAILEIHRGVLGELDGELYSKLFGLVGRLHLLPKRAKAHDSLKNYIPGLVGHYVLQDDEHWILDVEQVPLLEQGFPNNPFSQIALNGWKRLEGSDLVPTTVIETLGSWSYDYFSGWFAAGFTKHVVGGAVREDYLSLLPMGTLYLAKHPPPGFLEVYVPKRPLLSFKNVDLTFPRALVAKSACDLPMK